MISVAAELAEMHPQTLRMYEARGLITPKRSPKNTRLYSQDDVDRLRRIQKMTAEEGLNLAGVETVLEMEAELERTRLRGGEAAREGGGFRSRDGQGDRPHQAQRRDRALRQVRRRGIRAGRGSQALDLPLPAVEQGHGAPVRGDAVDLNLTAADHEVGVDLGVVEELALRRVFRQVLDRPAEPGAIRDM